MRSDIIGKVGKAVSKTAQKAAKASGDAIDFTKLKIKLVDIGSKLDEKYAQIGRLVYEGESGEGIDEICDEIGKLREEEEDIKLKIDSYRSKKICDSCGEKVDAKFDYCPNCGNKFE